MRNLKPLLTLCGALMVLPALAQTPSETNLDPKAARMEARNARGSQLMAVTPEQGMTNALKRCANLPPFYRTDCEARVQGQGSEQSGSVIGGGIIRETVTTMPESDLQAMKRDPQQMELTRPLNTRPAKGR